MSKLTAAAMAALLVATPAVACTSLEAIFSPEYYRGLAGDDSQLGDLLSGCFWKGLAEREQNSARAPAARGCASGWYPNNFGTCTQNGFFAIDRDRSCPNGTHPEQSKCTKDGEHVVNENGETCQDGFHSIGDHKCQKDAAQPPPPPPGYVYPDGYVPAPELPPHRLESGRQWHWNDSRPLPVPQGDYVRADEGALTCMRRRSALRGWDHP
jgi:hypothetical protein